MVWGERPDRAGTAVVPGVASTAAGVGELEMTSQCEGAVTVNLKVPLRSGCSNTANIRRESGTSNCVYRYTSLSTGSTKRCRPSPVFMYGASATTVSSLAEARSGNWIRIPSETAAGSKARPLSVTLCTACVTASMKVVEPGTAVNFTVVVVPKIFPPLVRSRTTS
ncbi:hypothetical protein AHiyo4_28370 [Arthrobacter sp. Hiyo4]|nr:hypothetical protein AHiyo4_28370 [Arthrobacter sp. Hiyo4]